MTIGMAAATFAAILTVGACGASGDTRDREPQARAYEARGVVREVRPARNSLTVHHEAVPGYMPEMTMPFDVADPAMLETVEVGDRIVFTFTPEAQGRHVIRSIRRSGPS